MAELSFTNHDHGACITDGVARADAACRVAGLHFTPVRRRVLEILLQEHRAIGAYDVLEFLRQEGLGSQPPVAYRALDFLVKNGFAHKIERLNAFVACAHAGQQHMPVFLICRACDMVAETRWSPDRSELGHAAEAIGFEVEAVVVEALGTCPNCRESAPV